MTKATKIPNAALNVLANAYILEFSNGYLRFYDNAEPGVNSALSGNNLLHECRFQTTAAPAAVNGLITFNSLTTATILLSGTVTFARAFKSDGTTVIGQYNVGVAASVACITVPSTTLVAGVSWTAGTFTHAIPGATTGL